MTGLLYFSHKMQEPTSLTMLWWNEASGLDVASYITIFNQSECFISEYHSWTMPNIVNDTPAPEIRKNFWSTYGPCYIGHSVFKYLYIGGYTQAGNVRHQVQLYVRAVCKLHQDISKCPCCHSRPFSAMLPVWPDWAIYWTLGNFLKPLAQLICPNLPHS